MPLYIIEQIDEPAPKPIGRIILCAILVVVVLSSCGAFAMIGRMAERCCHG
jgi:hypothetical protein